MINYATIKKILIDKKMTVKELAKLDGRSRQYLVKECSLGNEKVLKRLYDILMKI